MPQSNGDHDARPSSRASANPPGDPYQADVYAGEETHLLDYVKVLHKRRGTVVAVFLTVVLSTVVYAFTQVPIYEARTRILIETGNQNIVQFQQVLEEQSSNYQDDYYETQYQLLQSRSLIRLTLDQLDLWNDPVFVSIPRQSRGL